ncbi:unnamed protein product, partial [marine sediment metagenome]
GSRLVPGAVTAGRLGNNSVTTEKISDGQVMSGDLAAGAVTRTKIANGAVTTTRIADQAVTGAKLAFGAVTAGRLGNNSVTTEKITDGQVKEADLAAGAVTRTKIANGAVTSIKLAEGAITTSKFSPGATAPNADTVDGFDAYASSSPQPGHLLALSGVGEWPESTIPQHDHSALDVTTGTLADARLSSNVALLDSSQTFTGTKTFSARPSFTSSGAPFSVTSQTKVANLNADLLDGMNAADFVTYPLDADCVNSG